VKFLPFLNRLFFIFPFFSPQKHFDSLDTDRRISSAHLFNDPLDFVSAFKSHFFRNILSNLVFDLYFSLTCSIVQNLCFPHHWHNLYNFYYLLSRKMVPLLALLLLLTIWLTSMNKSIPIIRRCPYKKTWFWDP
jgi:hypothetical protein